MKRAIAAAAIARGSILSIGVLTLVLFAPTMAQANAPRVTRGDAQAVFRAFNNGGWAVTLNGGEVEGAPADFLPDSITRISPSAGWVGRHFCSLDWHVISVAAVEGNVAGGTRTELEIRHFLSEIKMDLKLDGTPLETERTAIARMLNPALRGFVEAFSVTAGRVMSPDELSIGQHSIQFTGQRPGLPPNVMAPVTFFIDGPGVGTCV